MEEEDKQENWGSSRAFLAILSETNGREINPKILTKLAEDERIKRKPFDGHTFLYYLPIARTLIIPVKTGAGNRKTTNRRSKDQTN
jgi:hypothetical protein